MHRARLGLIPLNAYGFDDGTNIGRRCNSQIETLPHVLNHCPQHNRAIMSRHNPIVARIKTAASAKMRLMAEDREVLEGVHTRPDLFLVHQRTAFIVDVTIVFENRRTAFEEAHARKNTKYIDIRQSLLQSYELKSFPLSSALWDLGTPKMTSS